MSEKRMPDILIEQYVLGELPEDLAREVEVSEGFVERVAAIEAANAAFAEQCPPEVFAARIRNRFEARQQSTVSRAPSRARTVRIMAFALPGAAALLVFGLVFFGSLGVNLEPGGGLNDEITRLKGSDATLSVYRSVPGRTVDAEKLADGALVSRGDRLQIAYRGGEDPYGVIVSVDGRGTVTLHHPLTATTEPRLTLGGEQRLPYAYELDDAPAFEKFYFITSDETFEVSTILASIREQADRIVTRPDSALQLPDRFSVETVTVRKGE